MDILVFALFVMALILRKYPIAAVLLILLSAGLKFYPAAALAALWSRGGMRQRLVAVGGVVFFFCILFLLKSQLAGIGASLSGQYQSAFGSNDVADLLKNHGACSESVAGFLSKALQICALGLGVLGWESWVAARVFSYQKNGRLKSRSVQIMHFGWRRLCF